MAVEIKVESREWRQVLQVLLKQVCVLELTRGKKVDRISGHDPAYKYLPESRRLMLAWLSDVIS